MANPTSEEISKVHQLAEAGADGNLLFQNGDLVDFIETTDHFDFYSYSVKSVLVDRKTAFQNVLIADTHNYGLILVLDGAIQSSEDDESLYHEVLVQPAMLAHPKPENVLIVGGGEGATLREVLSHNSVQSVTMVDIDAEAVALCKEYLTDWHEGKFDDPRLRLVYDDGRAFIERDETKYDVVIVDVVDMLDNGPAQALYTKQFYELLRKRLNPKAIVAVQAMEFSHLDSEEHAALSRTLKQVFSQVHSYRAAIPSFLSSWGFIVASDWFNPRELTAAQYDKLAAERILNRSLEHIDGSFLLGCFGLCKETVRLLSEPGPILEDGVDFYVGTGA